MKTIEGITMEWLQARVIEEGECMLWTGYIGCGNIPRVQIGGKVMTTRSAIWQWVHGRKLPTNCRATATCNNPACVNPDHIEAKPINYKLKGTTHTLARSAKTARTFRAASKFTDDVIAAIRVSDESLNVLAARYGMSKQHASKIRNGESRKDFKNPYLQLVSSK